MWTLIKIDSNKGYYDVVEVGRRGKLRRRQKRLLAPKEPQVTYILERCEREELSDYVIIGGGLMHPLLARFKNPIPEPKRFTTSST